MVSNVDDLLVEYNISSWAGVRGCFLLNSQRSHLQPDCTTTFHLQNFHCCREMAGLFQINQEWVLIVLTLTLLVLTCLQARGSILTRYLTLVNQSRSYSIFFLRAFSEIAGVSLSATIYATLERLKWAMICRKGQSRARFVDFLALQESTTILGLLSLATGAAVPSVTTRIWSIVRLILMFFVPGIGILIMSMHICPHLTPPVDI